MQSLKKYQNGNLNAVEGYIEDLDEPIPVDSIIMEIESEGCTRWIVAGSDMLDAFPEDMNLSGNGDVNFDFNLHFFYDPHGCPSIINYCKQPDFAGEIYIGLVQIVTNFINGIPTFRYVHPDLGQISHTNINELLECSNGDPLRSLINTEPILPNGDLNPIPFFQCHNLEEISLESLTLFPQRDGGIVHFNREGVYPPLRYRCTTIHQSMTLHPIYKTEDTETQLENSLLLLVDHFRKSEGWEKLNEFEEFEAIELLFINLPIIEHFFYRPRHEKVSSSFGYKSDDAFQNLDNKLSFLLDVFDDRNCITEYTVEYYKPFLELQCKAFILACEIKFCSDGMILYRIEGAYWTDIYREWLDLKQAVVDNKTEIPPCPDPEDAQGEFFEADFLFFLQEDKLFVTKLENQDALSMEEYLHNKYNFDMPDERMGEPSTIEYAYEIFTYPLMLCPDKKTFRLIDEGITLEIRKMYDIEQDVFSPIIINKDINDSICGAHEKFEEACMFVDLFFTRTNDECEENEISEERMEAYLNKSYMNGH